MRIRGQPAVVEAMASQLVARLGQPLQGFGEFDGEPGDNEQGDSWGRRVGFRYRCSIIQYSLEVLEPGAHRALITEIHTEYLRAIEYAFDIDR
jgi:hypothetical protein